MLKACRSKLPADQNTNVQYTVLFFGTMGYGGRWGRGTVLQGYMLTFVGHRQEFWQLPASSSQQLSLTFRILEIVILNLKWNSISNRSKVEGRNQPDQILLVRQKTFFKKAPKPSRERFHCILNLLLCRIISPSSNFLCINPFLLLCKYGVGMLSLFIVPFKGQQTIVYCH